MQVVPMESSVNAEAESASENQTRCITTRVANIRISGVIASDEPCESSDEEVVEALSLCSPDDTCKSFCLFLCHSDMFAIVQFT